MNKKARYYVPKAPEAKALQNANAVIAAQRKTTGRVEMKVTYQSDARDVTSTGYIVSLVDNLSRGTAAVNECIGNEVLPTSVRVHAGIAMGQSIAANGDGTNFVRIIVFQWYDSTTPAVSGILQTVTPFGMLLWENIENIKVLADRLIPLKQQGIQSDSHDAWAEKIYIKGKKMVPVKLNAAGTAIQKGEIYILVLSDSSVVAHPYCTFYSQVTYTDS